MDINHSLHEPQTIPESFLDAHYCQHHVMHALEMTEPEFWAAYVSGLIPRGVSLMALTGVPLVVWPKQLLDDWHAAGRQPEAGALELQNQVLHSLMDAFKAQGVVFPNKPPIYEPELN